MVPVARAEALARSGCHTALPPKLLRRTCSILSLRWDGTANASSGSGAIARHGHVGGHVLAPGVRRRERADLPPVLGDRASNRRAPRRAAACVLDDRVLGRP